MCSEHNYILQWVVHWVHNYIFRPCILAIVRLYINLSSKYTKYFSIGPRQCHPLLKEEISSPPGHPTRILYSSLIRLSTTWRWSIYRAETCSYIPNVLLIVKYSCVLTICLTLILPRSRTGTVWFYTSTSNKRAARPKLYTKSLTRDIVGAL